MKGGREERGGLPLTGGRNGDIFGSISVDAPNYHYVSYITISTMSDFFKGTEIKFAVELVAEGFSMDDDEWELQVISGKTSISIPKSSCQREVTTIDPPVTDSSSSSSEPPVEVVTWYAIADTSTLSLGSVRVVATAHIPDTAAADGVRNEIDVKTLCHLVNP